MIHALHLKKIRWDSGLGASGPHRLVSVCSHMRVPSKGANARQAGKQPQKRSQMALIAL